MAKSTTGNRLHAIIKQWTGQDYKPDCGCEAVVKQMNSHTPQWTLDNMPMILEKLRTAAANRKWWNLLAKIPGAKFPLRWMIRQAVKLALKDAENESQAKAETKAETETEASDGTQASPET